MDNIEALERLDKAIVEANVLLDKVNKEAKIAEVPSLFRLMYNGHYYAIQYWGRSGFFGLGKNKWKFINEDIGCPAQYLTKKQAEGIMATMISLKQAEIRGYEEVK